jgi:hypothetical protein
VHIGVCVGFGRLAMSWDFVDDLPPSFQHDHSSDVPWSAEAIVL